MPRVCVLAVLILLNGAVGLMPTAQGQRPLEYDVKAAFLYNFVHFVQWPADTFADSAQPLTIGIFGDNPFGDVLERIVSGETVNQRAIRVRHTDVLDDLVSCQIVFTTLSDRAQVTRLLDHLSGRSVLTVGDAGRFTEFGGVVGFVSEASRVRFDINVKAAAQARLKLSSKLLKVARQRIGG